MPRQRLEMVKNAAYWDRARIPQTDRLVLLPIPDASTRVAALLSGQVDWIEAPPPDAVPRPGAVIGLAPDPAHLHFFDARGRALG